MAAENPMQYLKRRVKYFTLNIYNTMFITYTIHPK